MEQLIHFELNDSELRDINDLLKDMTEQFHEYGDSEAIEEAVRDFTEDVLRETYENSLDWLDEGIMFFFEPSTIDDIVSTVFDITRDEEFFDEYGQKLLEWTMEIANYTLGERKRYPIDEVIIYYDNGGEIYMCSREYVDKGDFC